MTSPHDLHTRGSPLGDEDGRQLLERLWESCRRRGVDRRTFMAAVAAGAAGSFLAGCVDGNEGAGPAEEGSPWVKDPGPFIPHGGKNLEARLEHQETFLTPNELFFVRNNSRTVEVDAEEYRLVVQGPSVGEPLDLGYEDVLQMPRRSVFAYIECGGNQRSFFDRVMDRPATGTQWGRGGIGMAEWTGVPMVEVLERAELGEDAVDLLLVGLDEESPEGGFRRPLPVDKALDPDTLLATHMNGVPLPPDHGFPLRAVVPGWVGSTNIKWLGRIEAHPERLWTRNNTTSRPGHRLQLDRRPSYAEPAARQDLPQGGRLLRA
ncbi:MAG: molybdopterin-dependent oxidoreductase [Acidobacteriota bacterium]